MVQMLADLFELKILESCCRLLVYRQEGNKESGEEKPADFDKYQLIGEKQTKTDLFTLICPFYFSFCPATCTTSPKL